MEPSMSVEFSEDHTVPILGSSENSETKENDTQNFTAVNRGSLLKGWRSFIGIFFALMASALFSLILLIAKLLERYHPFMLSFWRTQGMFAIIPFIIYYSLWEKKPIFSTVWPVTAQGNGKNIFLLFVMYISGASNGILQYYSIHYINIADSSTVASSTPIFVSLAGYIALREKSGAVKILSGLLALCGVAVITRPPFFTGEAEFDKDILIGLVMAVGSMAFNVVYFITQRSLLEVHSSVIMLFIGIFGSIFTSACAVGVSQFEVPDDLHDWILVGSLVLLAFVPQMCCTLAFKFEEAGIIAIFRTFDIIFAFVWQYIFLGVVPDWISLVGGSIVFSAVLLAAIKKCGVSRPLE